MGPKKNLQMEDDVEDIKKSLNFLTEEVTAVRLQQSSILDLVKEVKTLRIQKISNLPTWRIKVAELEQYTRINNVIVTGLQVKPRSYARAVTADSEGGDGELDVGSTEQQVAAFLQSKGIHLNCNNIELCHPLPRRNSSDKPAKIIRFVNRKHKIALLREGRRLKGTDVYLNEHLTKRNAEIAKNARYLKKQKKIQNTWTTNCKIFIKLNGPPEEAKVLVIRDVAELVKYQ